MEGIAQGGVATQVPSKEPCGDWFSVATLAKRLYDSYHINVAVMAPGGEEPETQPEAIPPQAKPQPPAQPASGPSHPPSQAGLFQASGTSSTIPHR